jgi:hypothetical protein
VLDVLRILYHKVQFHVEFTADKLFVIKKGERKSGNSISIMVKSRAKL